MTPAKQKQKTKPSCILLAYNGTEYACLSQKRRNVYILRKYGQKKDQILARSIQSPIPPCLVSGSLDSQGLLWLHHSSFAACNPSSLSPLSLFCSSSPPYSSIYWKIPFSRYHLFGISKILGVFTIAQSSLSHPWLPQMTSQDLLAFQGRLLAVTPALPHTALLQWHFKPWRKDLWSPHSCIFCAPKSRTMWKRDTAKFLYLSRNHPHASFHTIATFLSMFK